MKVPECLKAYLPQRGNPTTITVKVPEEKKRKVVKRIDAADIAYCETDNHNMIIYMVDGKRIKVIHTKDELLGLFNAVRSEDSMFVAIGKFYIVNLKHIIDCDRENEKLVFEPDTTPHTIYPSKKALSDFFIMVTEIQRAEEVRVAEKQTIYVREAGTSSLPSNMRGFIQPPTYQYKKIEEYVFDDDKAYLI